MRAHILQHVPFEDIGCMRDWLTERKATIQYTRFHEAEWALPDPAGLDLLIIMGGPMSVNDEAELPWLIKEKEFIREALQRRVPTLGICLGAQLIANAMGAKVYPGPQKEIGWHPITAPPASKDSFPFPDRQVVFHWHGETFDLPQGAIRLAESEVCTNQAFQIGDHALGLQFHLETTPESLEAIITHCGHELTSPSSSVQSAEEMSHRQPGIYGEMNALMVQVLNYLTLPD